MPRALTMAGFEVALLAPRGSLAEKSRFVTKIGHLDADAAPLQWLHAFAAMVSATSPRLVMPCDDMSLRLLQALVLAPPGALQPVLALRLSALVRDSLGEPAWYRASIDKTLLPPAAAALGVRVPPYAIISESSEAEAFAARHGYPVVMKRSHSAAGDGVAICADAAALSRAFADLHRSAGVDLGDTNAGKLCVQAHVRGRTMFYPTMAWRGEMLTGYAGEKIVGNPEPKGPPTVNRYFRSPELRDFAVRLARGFGITGFFSPEFVTDERTGEPHLIEINRRLVGGAHRGSAIGVDHCAALHAALLGQPVATRADLDEGESHYTVHFPQEWLRDPGSSWLRDYPADVPWDDPGLIEAMLAMRHDE